MTTLERTQRQQLEKVIQEARVVAETAATAVLTELGVGDAVAPSHLDNTVKDLRRRLRIHGRQLGDLRDNLTKSQETVRLKEEIAYEHWHRMLFARFLAENNLLMYPDENNPISITLEECEELAVEQGLNNGWEVAARYAAKMLPQIFRLSSPVFELKLPKNRLRQLEQLLTSLSDETFLASDSLGWVYQFWQAKRKDEVNASEVKIGARELPAVTQLFTEDYMVSFLLDNSLGAWWAAKKLGITDEEVGVEAENEEELRQRVSIPGVPLEYLRFAQLADGTWIPAGGIFKSWPGDLNDLKVMDPSCGSGHFLVAAFLMLVPLRRELDSLTPLDAVSQVLSENIHGLELDQRCVELAAFSLALAAWKYPDAGGYGPLPELNIACSGLSISAKEEDWLSLAYNTNIRMSLEELYKDFKDASILGSLINPSASLKRGTLFDQPWEDVGPILAKALSKEHNVEKSELGIVAFGIAKAATLLTSKYHWIITNVPYLGMKRMDKTLYEYCEANYSTSKADLATVFLNRWIRSSHVGANISLVMPQNWLFLGSYKAFRNELLANQSLNYVVLLGSRAFETITGEVVQANLFSLNVSNVTPTNICYGIDASGLRPIENKSRELRLGKTTSSFQKELKKNPDQRFVVGEFSEDPLLATLADSKRGIVNGDNERWLKKHWEKSITNSKKWRLLQSAVNKTTHYSGRELIIDWSQKGHTMLRPGLGNPLYGQKGIASSRMGDLASTIYTGELYDQSTAVLVPNNTRRLEPLLCYAEDTLFCTAIRKLDKKVGVTPATFLKIPYNQKNWGKIAQEKYPNGLPEPYSNDLNQWIFHGHPCGSVIWDEAAKWTAKDTLRMDNTVLQIAVARLLGYRWPAEMNPDMELANEQREWVKRCEELLPLADEDGIVCIPSVRGEATAADRLLKVLVKSYGDQWNNQILSELLTEASAEGRTLDTWLRDYFFTQHMKLFKHRPFIWNIWDGLVDGFSVLVNYHKLDQKLLETLIYDYLGDWISRQKRDIAQLIPGAEEKLAAAEVLKKRLELILSGEQPYDIFVRWKLLDQQSIGWDPDLNDGVRLNIRPFMTVPDIKKRGAGVLRDKPNIHWKKDRGKDVVSAPWYNLGPEYDGKEGDRINDHHLSLAEKQAARIS